MKNLKFRLRLLTVLVLFLTQLTLSTQAAEYMAAGHDKNGWYKEMVSLDKAEDTRIGLIRHPRYISAMGMMVETNPKFTISGRFAGNQIDLKIEPEDILVKIGGMNVVTRVDYHVDGMIGKEPVKAVIRDDHPITGFSDGVNVQTGFRKKIDGPGLVFEQVTETTEVSGINIVSGRYYILGSVTDKNLSLKIENYSESVYKITGDGNVVSSALAVALRPFLL